MFYLTSFIVEGRVPFAYLEVPIFSSKPRITHLRHLADKIISKFDRWSGSLLSLAGRVCLVNSVIVSSLTHSMMVYRWPRALLKQVDVAMRNFIWNGDVNKQSCGIVAWAQVCASHEEGGLGVRSIRAANEGFLCKLAWEILVETDPALSFILQRHTTAGGRDVRYFISSSIWHGLDRIRDMIREQVR